MRTMKRSNRFKIVSVLLALVMVVSLVPAGLVPAMAAQGDWVTIIEPVAGESGHLYTQYTESSVSDGDYLIVEANDSKAMDNNDASGIKSVDVTVNTGEDPNEILTENQDYEWQIDSDRRISTMINGSRYYLRASKGTWNNNVTLSLTTTQSDGTQWTFGVQSNGQYQIYVSFSSWGRTVTAYLTPAGTDASAQNVRLFRYDRPVTEESASGLFARLDGEASYSVELGTSEEAVLEMVKENIYTHEGAEEPGLDVVGTPLADDSLLNWTWGPTDYNSATSGQYELTVSYDGKVLGTVEVAVTAKIVGYTMISTSGSVLKDTEESAETGATIRVDLEDGTFYMVPVTVDMLSRQDNTAVDTSKADVYEKLKVTYNDEVICEDFTLVVLGESVNDTPEYPNEGAIKVEKTATGLDFQNSGIAQVELSVSGVPTSRGADVILMLDTSSSMGTCTTCASGTEHKSSANYKCTAGGQTRAQVLEDSLADMLTQFRTGGANGTPLDIRVAIANFNGYYRSSGTPYYVESDDKVGGDNGTQNPSSNPVKTGGSGAHNNHTADAFVHVSDTSLDDFAEYSNSETLNLDYTSGTNYDYAFDAIYQLGHSIQADNEAKGIKRDLYVIFMTDGTPYQWNYYTSERGRDAWNGWLQGTYTTLNEVNAVTNCDTHSYYYDLTDWDNDGQFNEHRMANAIKGDPEQQYEVIRKVNTLGTPADKTNLYMVDGLGAKLFAINFAAAPEGQMTMETIQKAIPSLASPDEEKISYYHEADNADELKGIFNVIGAHIVYAADNAHFEDQMSDYYDLQIDLQEYQVKVTDANGNASIENRSIAPVIQLKSYAIWTRLEYLAGKCTEAMIGTRKMNVESNNGEPLVEILETVCFSNDGTKAYSDRVDADGDGVYGLTYDSETKTYSPVDADDNIFHENVICAKNFYYNNNSEKVTVQDGEITVDATAFYWNVGTVKSSELAISYQVYLKGSREGKLAPGTYPTNNYARLYYDNYKGNFVANTGTPSPSISWEAASVWCAFYLVDEDTGKPVNSNGDEVPFAQRVAVSQPVLFGEVALNAIEKVEAIKVPSLDKLPEGYTLYDEQAAYTISISSIGTGSWSITSANGKAASTYVTNYDPKNTAAATNATSMSDLNYDYTNTVVWFAVKWMPKCIPDSVVIDYALPVDITVLGNDMFGDQGKVVGVMVADEDHDDIIGQITGDDESAVTSAYAEGQFGTVRVVNGRYIRYTPNGSNMEMSTYEKFVYAVEYNEKYFYGTITVIPASIMYFEESFVTYNSDPAASGDHGKWVDSGTPVDGRQSEDRPDFYSVGAYDANNVYGYDEINNGITRGHSMGRAKMVMVSGANNPYGEGGGTWPTATFTFTGTAFDLFSVTASNTGVVDISVEGPESYVWSVNTFCETDMFHQIPIIKSPRMKYGTYTVTVTPKYISIFDRNLDGDNSYCFYLDGVRIYNPADDGIDGSDRTIYNAYGLDKENHAVFTELRNQVIDAQTFNSLGSGEVSGVVFIDELKDSNVIEDYSEFGPNNELYLSPGQAVAARVDAASNGGRPVASIHLGIKTLYAAGNVNVYGVGRNGQGENVEIPCVVRAIDSSSEMYYDITALNGMTMVIQNTGSTGSGIISITNIKVTYADTQSDGQSGGGENPALLSVDKDAVELVLDSLNEND